MAGHPFEQLDFVYMPSRDVAADLAFYTRVLGGEVAWAIERFDTRVAQVTLSGGGPALVLAQHMHGERPVLVHRVESLDAAIAELEERGHPAVGRLEFPYGPIAELDLPGPQRIAIYELTRPDRGATLAGRHDFEPAE